jgi:hypothetical protein
LILSAFPSAALAKRQTEFVKAYWKTEPELIITKAREEWKCLKSR